MNHNDTPVQHSVTERQLRRLVVPEPATYAAYKRLDVTSSTNPTSTCWGDQE